MWQPTMPLGGVFRAADERLFHANKVFVPYCTSDSHMADTTHFGYEFRGQRIVKAVLEELVSSHGMGMAGASESRLSSGEAQLLVFGGFSAGARGAMVHLDAVPHYLGAALGHHLGQPLGDEAAARMRIIGLLDSPLWLDITPMHGPDSYPARLPRTEVVRTFDR